MPHRAETITKDWWCSNVALRTVCVLSARDSAQSIEAWRPFELSSLELFNTWIIVGQTMLYSWCGMGLMKLLFCVSWSLCIIQLDAKQRGGARRTTLAEGTCLIIVYVLNNIRFLKDYSKIPSWKAGIEWHVINILNETFLFCFEDLFLTQLSHVDHRQKNTFLVMTTIYNMMYTLT